MAYTSWPMLLDYTNDDCRRNLRKLELEAYASVVSAFRAQGEMNKEKKKMLQELSTVLSISMDRHRAEIRRAVNDERLNTIADRLAGPNTSTEWSIEGRRVIPLLSRFVPQTAFTAIANYAADAQAARNAMLPVPSATGLKETFLGNENVIPDELECKQKRPSSVEPEATPQKLLALDSPSTGSTSSIEMLTDNNSDFHMHSPSPVPQCVLQAVRGKESGFTSKRNSGRCPVSTTAQRSTFTSSVLSAKPVTTGNLPMSSNLVAPPKPLSVPVVKTVSAPLIPVPLHPGSSCVSSAAESVTSKSLEDVPVSNSCITSTGETTSVNSLTTPLFSTPCGLPQAVSSSSLPSASSGFVSRPKPKMLPASKPLMRPRLTTSNMFPAPSTTSFQTTTVHIPAANSLQPIRKTVSPLKPRPSVPCSRVSPPSSQSSTTSVCQNTVSSQTFSRAQSPVTALPRVAPPVSNAHRAISPIALKQCQTTVPSSTINKTAISPKSITKTSTIRPPLGPRALLASSAKSPVSNSVTSLGPSASNPRPSLQVQTKTPIASKLPPGKANVAVAYSQKSVQNQNPPKAGGNPVAKAVHYRNENGLKIISQNMATNLLLPKTGTIVSSQANTNSPNRVIVTTSGPGVTGSARIINFSQPISARFARTVQTSTVSSVNLTNSVSGSGIRVALPVGVNSSSMLRAGVPAKPNVIVVHKAQVWPQTPGATIVMTSSGPLSRLSNEAIEEAVSLMQRQETSRHTGSSTSLKALTLHQTVTSQPSNVVTAHPQTLKVLGKFSTAIHTEERSVREVSSSTHLHEKTSAPRTESNKSSSTARVSSTHEGNQVTLKEDGPAVSLPSSLMCTDSLEDSSSEVKLHDNEDKDVEIISSNQSTGGESGVKLLKSRESMSKNNRTMERKDVDMEVDESEKTVSSTSASVTTLLEDINLGKQKIIRPANSGQAVSSTMNVQHINLNQLLEGQILELQAQDAAELLSQHGQLSSEVMELLQQAGLHVDKLEVPGEEPFTQNCKDQGSSGCVSHSSRNISLVSVEMKDKTREVSLAPTASTSSSEQKYESDESSNTVNEELGFLDLPQENDCAKNSCQKQNDQPCIRKPENVFLGTNCKLLNKEGACVIPVDKDNLDGESLVQSSDSSGNDNLDLSAGLQFEDDSEASSLSSLVVKNFTSHEEMSDSDLDVTSFFQPTTSTQAERWEPLEEDASFQLLASPEQLEIILGSASEGNDCCMHVGHLY